MKNKNNLPRIGLPSQAYEACGFSGGDTLELHVGDSALVIIRDRMTALEAACAVETLSAIASNLTVELAKAGGICNNCGKENPKPCSDCNDSAVSAQPNGCKDTPANWVANCSLCQDILDGDGIILPDYVLADAGIPKGIKLEACADEGGKIAVTESERQLDLTDLPPSVLAVLTASGVCLAELDERIMRRDIIYGN